MIRHAQKIELQSKKLLEIIPIFIQTLVTQYEEINNEKLIKQVLEDEINKFTETLDTGLDILDKSMKKIINSKSKKEISGELLFLLTTLMDSQLI